MWRQPGGRPSAQKQGPGRYQPGADGGRHGVAPRFPPGPIRWKEICRGFSFGATLGASAAAQRPDLVATLVAVGMDIDGAAAGTCAYDFALAAARQRGNQRATRQLEAIGPPPHLKPKQFATRVRWATNFGRVTIGETYAALGRDHPRRRVRRRRHQLPGPLRRRRSRRRAAPRSRHPSRHRPARPRRRRIGVASMTALEVGFVAELPAWRHGRLAQRFDSARVTGKPILRHWL